MTAPQDTVGQKLSRRFVSQVRSLRDDPLLSERRDELGQLLQLYPEPVGRLNAVYLEAQLYLAGRDVETCHEMIRWALSSALPPARSDQIAAMLRNESQRVQTFLGERAERVGRRRYATSLYWGIVISVFVLAAVAVLALGVIKLFRSIDGQPGAIPPGTMLAVRDVLVCVGGGAAGAVLSTVLRVSNLDKIDYRVVTRRTAAFRIVLGWLFAAALLFLIKGAIVTVFNVPEESAPSSFFFWGGIGFLAGFNEVWARNLVTRSGAEPAPTKPSTPEAPAKD